MTQTRPSRRMIRHFSHIFFTDGRTFTASTFRAGARRANPATCWWSGGPDDGSRPRNVVSFFL